MSAPLQAVANSKRQHSVAFWILQHSTEGFDRTWTTACGFTNLPGGATAGLVSRQRGNRATSSSQSESHRTEGARHPAASRPGASIVPGNERHVVTPTADRARVDRRRRESRRVIVASMAASIAIHAFVFSVSMVPSGETGRHAGTLASSPGPPTSSDAPSGIRITRIVVADLATQPELSEAVTEHVVTEPSEPELEDADQLEPDDPQSTPDVGPKDPSPAQHTVGNPSVTREDESPRDAGTEPATRLRPRFTNPALWREIRGARADTEWTSGMLLRDRAEGGRSRYSPPDAWAFDTWTTRDAAGRLWGVAPGSIYLAGFGIRTCGGRFDASRCGFGLPGWKRRKYQRSLQTAIEIENQQRWRGMMERDRAIRERRDAQRHPKTDSIPGHSR